MAGIIVDALSRLCLHLLQQSHCVLIIAPHNCSVLVWSSTHTVLILTDTAYMHTLISYPHTFPENNSNCPQDSPRVTQLPKLTGSPTSQGPPTSPRLTNLPQAHPTPQAHQPPPGSPTSPRLTQPPKAHQPPPGSPNSPSSQAHQPPKAHQPPPGSPTSPRLTQPPRLTHLPQAHPTPQAHQPPPGSPTSPASPAPLTDGSVQCRSHQQVQTLHKQRAHKPSLLCLETPMHAHTHTLLFTNVEHKGSCHMYYFYSLGSLHNQFLVYATNFTTGFT